KVFRLKLPGLRELLRGDERPFQSRAVYTTCDEGARPRPMTRVAELHSDVSIGSYPVTDRVEYRVKLTIDGTDPASIARAETALRAPIPHEKLVDFEEWRSGRTRLTGDGCGGRPATGCYTRTEGI